MDFDPALRPWLREALQQLGSSAAAVDVARWVWAHHEADLRAAGDLFYTWQVELRACAEAMATEAAQAPRTEGWDGTELEAAVQAYLALLIAENGGAPARRSQVVADLIATTRRNTAQVEALLCNISAVIQEHGLIPLSHYRPRSNVPLGVRPAVAAALAALG